MLAAVPRGDVLWARTVRSDPPDVVVIVQQDGLTVLRPARRAVGSGRGWAVIILIPKLNRKIGCQIRRLAVRHRDRVPILAVEEQQIFARWRPGRRAAMLLDEDLPRASCRVDDVRIRVMLVVIEV